MRSIIKPSHRATHCCAFSVRILLKILIHKQKRAESPMVSLAQGNTLRKSAFWSKILVKDLFYVAYARNLRGNLHVKSKDLNGPEIYLRFYFPKIFLAKQHLKEDFLQRFLAKQPKNPRITRKTRKRF